MCLGLRKLNDVCILSVLSTICVIFADKLK